MEAHTINDTPFHPGGRYGPGQEVYYAIHRIRLWKLYCIDKRLASRVQDASFVYRQKKEVLQHLCDMLGVSRVGTKRELIANLDRYVFTQEQIDAVGF